MKLTKIFLVLAFMSLLIGCATIVNPFSQINVEESVTAETSGQTDIGSTLRDGYYYNGANTDIMLQSFNWRSYNGSHGNWYTMLNSNIAAGQLIKNYFNVIWLPPPQKAFRWTINEYTDLNSACGYMPLDYYDLGAYQQWVVNDNGGNYVYYQHGGTETLYGSQTELKTLIATCTANGVQTLADLVLNHRAGKTGGGSPYYNYLWNDTTHPLGSGMLKWGEEKTLNDDETVGTSGSYEGNWSGNGRSYACNSMAYARDLNHWNNTNSVNSEIQTWMTWLKSTTNAGFKGWRYDVGDGFNNGALAAYNTATTPYLSVAEVWSGDRQKVQDYIDGASKKTMAFDFPLRDVLKMACDNGNWSGIATSQTALAGLVGWSRGAAVTFVDNHDTGCTYGYNGSGMSDCGQHLSPFTSGGVTQHGNNQAIRYAYAFIMSIPGTPQVYWYHWSDCGTGTGSLQDLIKKLITYRKSGLVKGDSVVNIMVRDSSGVAGYTGGDLNTAKYAFAIQNTTWTPSQGTGAAWGTPKINWDTNKIRVWTR